MSGLCFHQAPSPKPGRTDIWAERDGELVCSLEVMAAPVRLAGATLRTAGHRERLHRGGPPAPRLRQRAYGARPRGPGQCRLFDSRPLLAFQGLLLPNSATPTIGCDFALEVDTDVAVQADGGPPVASRECHRSAGGRRALQRRQRQPRRLGRDAIPRTGSACATARRSSARPGLWIADDTAAEPVGYVALREDPGNAEVIDAGFADSAVAPSLVAHAAAEGREAAGVEHQV